MQPAIIYTIRLDTTTPNDIESYFDGLLSLCKDDQNLSQELKKMRDYYVCASAEDRLKIDRIVAATAGQVGTPNCLLISVPPEHHHDILNVSSWTGFCLFHKRTAEVYLNALYVVPQCRRMRIGSQMVQHIIDNIVETPSVISAFVLPTIASVRLFLGKQFSFHLAIGDPRNYSPEHDQLARLMSDVMRLCIYTKAELPSLCGMVAQDGTYRMVLRK